jgi:hypothetical protein
VDSDKDEKLSAVRLLTRPSSEHGGPIEGGFRTPGWLGQTGWVQPKPSDARRSPDRHLLDRHGSKERASGWIMAKTAASFPFSALSSI